MNALFLFAALAVGNPADSLHCPAAAVDRGNVKGGPPLLHNFDLTHRGTTGTITITKVEAGCGCLRRSLGSETLQPGESTRLVIEINTLTQPDGPSKWQATVAYKVVMPAGPGTAPAIRQGELLLTVSANLSREVSVSPAQIGFSTTGEATQVITLMDRRAKPLTLLRASCSSPHLSAEIAPPAAGPNGTRVQTVAVKLAAAAPLGHREEAVTLLTDDPVYPEFRIPVRVLKRAAGGVKATPDAVAVRFAPGQTEVSALVQLRSAAGKPIEIATVESDNTAVTVKWSPGSVGVAAIRVSVAAGADRQPGGCVIRVRFADPLGAQTAIPVSWK